MAKEKPMREVVMESLGNEEFEKPKMSDAERIADLERKLEGKDEEIAQLESAIGQLEGEKEKLIKAEPDRKLWYRANYDALTGLRRKEGFIDEAEKLLRRMLKEIHAAHESYARERRAAVKETAPPAPDTFSVIVLDLDDFKFVNDTFGHQVGDQVLQMAGQVIRNAVREDDDVIGRWGGEELVVALKSQPGQRIRIAERIRGELEKIKLTAKDTEGLKRNVPITASVGVAKWEDGERFDDVFQKADAAMYKAKGAGKNRVWPAEGVEGVQEPLAPPSIRGTKKEK